MASILSSTAKEPLSTPHAKLLILIFGVSLFLLFLNSFSFSWPTGWDVFYSLRVLELTRSDGFLPFDPLSAGGRIHTYPPAYYALIIFFSSLTNLRLEFAVRLLSPIVFSLTALTVFTLARRKFGVNEAVLAVLLFSTSFEVLDAFSSAGMAASLGHFFTAFGLFAYFFFPTILFLVVALLLGSIHLLSATALAIYLVFLTLQNRNYKKLALAILCLAAFPLFWRLLFPLYNLPDWGITLPALELVGRIGFIQAILFGLSLSRDPFFLTALALLLLSKFSPLLASRWIYFSIIPLVLSIASFWNRKRTVLTSVFSRSFRLTGPLFFIAFLSVPLLLSQLHTGVYTKPYIRSADVDGLRWLRHNTPPTAVVVGYKDLSAVWVLYYAQRSTILDGYSESVPNVYEKMQDEYNAYSSDLTTASRLLGKHNVSYLFYDETEKNWFKEFDFSKFDSLPPLFDNGFARVIKFPEPF